MAIPWLQSDFNIGIETREQPGQEPTIVAEARGTYAGQPITGRATGGGKSVCFCEAQITDAEGTVTAKAMGTFKYVQP